MLSGNFAQLEPVVKFESIQRDTVEEEHFCFVCFLLIVTAFCFVSLTPFVSFIITGSPAPRMSHTEFS